MPNFHIYGLLIGIGALVALEIVKKFSEEENSFWETMFPWILVGGVIGARIYHAIDYWDRYYKYNFWEIFKIWNGGLGIWGGLIGGGVVVAIICKIYEKSLFKTFDDIVVGVPFAQAIGRLGNFANGELYGKNGEPLFAYEAVLNLILGFLLIGLAKQKRSTAGDYLIGYGLIRIVLENLRPEDVIWKIANIPVAIIFGMLAVMIGAVIIFRRR